MEHKKPVKEYAKFHRRMFILFVSMVALGGLVFAMYWIYSARSENEASQYGQLYNDGLEECYANSSRFGWRLSKRQSCEQFVLGKCPMLLEQYGLKERRETGKGDFGMRLPSLRESVDPFYPVDCYQQWRLIESELDPADLKPLSKYEGLAESSPEYFPHKNPKGELLVPENYQIEKRYSSEDQILLGSALKAAYKYSDVNIAVLDGYRPQPFFDNSMGIHFVSLDLLDETVEIDHPEFLTYIKSSRNNSYALAQIGYIFIKNNNFNRFRYPLFETVEAKGHNHFLLCVFVDHKGWIHMPIKTDDEPTGGRLNVHLESLGHSSMSSKNAIALFNDKRLNRDKTLKRTACFESVWMIHVAVNLYNERGLFSDTFPLINAMSKSGKIYSFFGRKLDLTDYHKP